MKRFTIVGAALVMLGLGARPAAAQVTLGWDVGAFSAYSWRGIYYTNKFVIQPDAYLTVPIGAASITGGAWFNIEPGKYNGATDLREGAGQSNFDVAEFDWWGEVGFSAGPATLTAGVTGYRFPNDSQFTAFNKSLNTVEIYGKAAFGGPLSPKLAIWYDVDKVKGAYGEASVSHSFHGLTLGALGGFNAGQGCDPDAAGVCKAAFFNFHDKSGFTHADLSASYGIAAGPLSITPVIHLIIGNDEATKWTKADPNSPTGLNSKGAKVWFGGTISWSKAFGGKEAAE